MVNQQAHERFPVLRDDKRTPTSSTSSSAFSSTRSSLSLSNVIQLCSPDTMRVETSVIAIPGYGTPPVEDWDMETQLREAGDSIDFPSHLHMYIHRPVYHVAEDFSWNSFLKAGSKLAEDLAQLSTEFPQRPIIFIAHSLGGVLLKKALILAHQNVHDPRFRLVVDCLSGILFLGTPHTGPTDKDTLLSHNQVLYNCAKIVVEKQASRLPDRDVFQLAGLASSFQQIARIPILSVFEYEDNRAKHKFFGNRKKVLVDEKLATISSNAEKLLGVSLTHQKLCKLPLLVGNTYSAREFLYSIFHDLASNERWSTEMEKAPLLETPKSNPLNPLNLAPIVPVRTSKGTASSPQTVNLPYRGWSSQSPPSSRPRRHIGLITTNTSRLLEKRKARLPCYYFAYHTPNPDFLGRTEAFALMDEYLLPQDMPETGNVNSTRSFALCGMGGIGKTTLAVQYAFSRQKKFGAVLWIEAGGVSQLATDFSRLSTYLGLETPEEAIDLESSKEIVKAWLNTPRRSNGAQNDAWLLIFNNADVLDIIADYIPYSGNGSVLVTSRDPFAKEHFFSNGGGIDMLPLDTADAAALLSRLSTRPGNPLSNDEQEAAIEVAKRLDGLPLAMTQMAGFIRRRHLSIREFADLYSSDARYVEIHDVSNPAQDRRYGHTLATAYKLEDFGEYATRLLQLLAFLNPDRVREDIFFNPKLPKAARGALESFWTASRFEEGRFELLSSSVIMRNISKKELWIHRVIQAEVRARMDEYHRYECFREVVGLLAALWPPGDHCSQVTVRWALCEDLLPHLERLYQLFKEYTEWSDYEVDPKLPMLMNEAAVYLHERGFSHEGKAYLELALELCERGNITEEPLMSDMHLTMGALANETNDTATCLEHNILCLALRKAEAARTNKPDLRLAFGHSQMGIAYMMTKMFALATDYFKQSIELLNIINADPDDYGFPVCNLGLAYWVQGELEAADNTLTNLLKQREEAFGKLDKVSYKTGRVLQALGNTRSSIAVSLETKNDHEGAQKFWDEAFEIHTNCLKQYESTLGKFSHRAADACHKLAEHHIRRKEDAIAQDYLDRALSIWGDRKWYRNESARSSFLRGTHLLSMGGEENIQKGTQWVERAKLLRSEILPDEEPKELRTEDFDDIVCFWSI